MRKSHLVCFLIVTFSCILVYFSTWGYRPISVRWVRELGQKDDKTLIRLGLETSLWLLNIQEGSYLRLNWEEKTIEDLSSIPEATRRPVAVIYFHGFSASPQELWPIPLQVARFWKAHLILPRLRGHGLEDWKILQHVTAHDWLSDAFSALLLARRLGEKILLMGNSTGSTLALILAYYFPEDFMALCLGSPNWGLKNPFSSLLSGFLGPIWASLLLGSEHGFQAKSAQQEWAWTTRYPSAVLVQVLEIVKLARNLKLENMQLPMVWFYSSKDHVLSVNAIEEAFARLGSKAKVIQRLDYPEHVLGGDIVAPENNHLLTAFCTDQLANLLVQ